MSLYQALDRLDEHQPGEFIAPILTRDTTRVLSIQNSIPYWFNIRVDTPGWYCCSPPQGGKAIAVDDAMPWERMQYLEQLNRFYVIALFPLDDTTWLVSPYNLGDADQRGWLAGEPRPMYLVEGTLQSLGLVKARVLGRSLLYDGMAVDLIGTSIINKSPAKIHASAIIEQRIKELEEQVRIERERQKRESAEELIKMSLHHTGAALVDWTRNINGYEITWEYNGQQHTMTVDTNLRVLSAGVCLAGTDRWHSLSSIVAVMEDRASGRDFAGYLDDDEDW